MRIGYALPLVKGIKEPLEKAELLASIGYDYVELPLAGFDLTGPDGMAHGGAEARRRLYPVEDDPESRGCHDDRPAQPHAHSYGRPTSAS